MPTAHWGFCLLTFASSTLVGFVGLLAAEHRWPAVAKVCSLAALLGVLFTVRAYEPIVFFLLQLAVIFAGVSASRWLDDQHEGQSKPTFSLNSLLALVAFTALLLGVAVRCSVPTTTIWLNLVGSAIGCGVATLVGGWNARAKPFRWNHVLISVAAIALCCIPMTVTDCYLAMYPRGWRWSETFTAQMGRPFPYGYNYAHWLAMLTAIFLTVHVLKWLSLRLQSPQPLPRFGSRFMFSVLMSALVGFCLIVFSRMPPYPSAVVESTITSDQESALGNGYRHLVSVAQEYLAKTNDTESNQTAIQGIEQAVAMPWSIPLRSKQDSIGKHWGATRPIYVLLDEEMKSAVDSGEIEDVLTYSELPISLANKYTRESNSVMGRYLGSSYGLLAMRHLSNVRKQMNLEQIVHALEWLASMEKEHVTFQGLMRKDREIAILIAGWRAMLYPAIASKKEQFISHTARQEWRKKHAVRRLLITDLMIRKYLYQHGTLPATLEVVVEEQYDNLEVTVDPCSDANAPFQYVRGEDGFLLYGVSVDGKDDQGKPPSDVTPVIGDLLLDSEFATSP